MEQIDYFFYELLDPTREESKVYRKCVNHSRRLKQKQGLRSLFKTTTEDTNRQEYLPMVAKNSKKTRFFLSSTSSLTLLVMIIKTSVSIDFSKYQGA